VKVGSTLSLNEDAKSNSWWRGEATESRPSYYFKVVCHVTEARRVAARRVAARRVAARRVAARRDANLKQAGLVPFQ
jgi:hypothetical protein